MSFLFQSLAHASPRPPPQLPTPTPNPPSTHTGAHTIELSNGNLFILLSSPILYQHGQGLVQSK